MPLKLRKRGEIWHYSGTVAGRRLRGSTKTALKDQAEIIANEVERRYLRGSRDPASVLTFAQAAIEYRKVRGAPKYLELVEDYWKDTPVKQINAGAVKRAAIALLPHAKGAYRNRAVIVPTLAVINYAADLDLCPPLKAKRFPEVHKTKEPATVEWVRAFMAHSSPHLGALCCFMFGTGARISEAIGILWRDVNLTEARVRIRMGKLGGEERVAHMPPELVAAIANIPGEREPDSQVFPYASYRACADPWEVAIKRAGIKRLTPHSCRHGFATSMLHKGFDPITVAKRGGWKDPSQLFKTYGHVLDDETITDALFGTPVTQKKPEDSEVVENKQQIA
jgi:integrase